MNFVENNGKKVAAILCVASAFPVVATVVAAKEEPGWHGDRYVNEDKTVAKGWQEIEGKSYYFSEDGTVDTSKTAKATTASVSSNITGEVKETVATASQEAVKEEVQEKEAVATPVETTTEAPVEDTVETPAETPAPEQTKTPAPEQTETPAPEQTETPAPEQTEIPAPEQTETPAPEQTETPAPEQTETPAPEQTETPTPEQTETPAPEQTVTPAPEQTETPAPEQTVTPAPESTPTTTTLGQKISQAAQQLVGVTDGLWCTQVVQQALANAGVSDAYQLWPDQYVGQYGYYTDSPAEGDLIYYNNGGRGVDHIAIYIGNGQAVHGNYNGKTVIAGAYVDGAGTPQYIRVVR
ncbi:C40 family peptidase [uncultured Holdemanella sp.]|uniref:C40 family peptidase n=1 Tax=uncultured Holdemanella sp. TaxID=1763549 RepID=UPI0025CFB163|nr:NlpC/P60 family protein [uncultured Holdemanella sp.]